MAYTAKTWVTGEVIQASDLNHAEQGIAAISANGAIDTANLAIASVTNEKLDQEAVDSNNIRVGAINTPLIYDGAVTLPKLGADVIDELDTKADIDGSYESMTVGNAEQLISSVGIEDQTPYNFRTSGGSVDIGDREELNAVVGATVAWNQLVDVLNVGGNTNGLTYTFGSNGALTISGTTNAENFKSAASIASRQGHKLLMIASPQFPEGLSFSTYYISDRRSYYLISGGNTDYIRFAYVSGVTVNYTGHVNLFDLTQMFGSTIADYIYSLEQSTPGAGVAWFRKLFPKPFYEFNSGELLSVKTSAHKMVGFNAYDHSTGKAKVVGGNVYQITGTYTALSLNGSTITPDASGYFTPSESGEITVTGGNGTTTCIHLKWDGERDGEYEAYQSWNYPLDSDLELRGIPKLDANNNLYYDGDTYAPDGTVTRRYGIVDLGTLTWYHNGENKVYATITGKKSGSQNIMANGFTLVPSTTDTGELTERQIKAYSTSSTITLYLSGITSANASTMLSGVYLVYELATPTTEITDPYQQTQIVDDFGTEEFVDASVEANERDVAVPVGNETVYKPNLRAKLEMAPDSPDGDGDYIVRQTNGQNSYIPLVEVKELPDMPSEDGNYTLRCTVTNGTATLSWVSA